MKYLCIYFLMATNIANACSGQIYKEYISSITYRIAPHSCGSGMKMLNIFFVKDYNKGDIYLNGASVLIRDSKGRIIIKFPLEISDLNAKPSGYVCITDDYVSNGTIEFYIGRKSVSHSVENSRTTNTLTLKGDVAKCQLRELIVSSEKGT
jgi:hypothetical protein